MKRDFWFIAFTCFFATLLVAWMSLVVTLVVLAIRVLWMWDV